MPGAIAWFRFQRRETASSTYYIKKIGIIALSGKGGPFPEKEAKEPPSSRSCNT